MKKILLLSISALLFTGAFAQKGNNGNNGKGKQNKEYKQKNKNDRSDNDDRYRNRNRDDDRDRDDDRWSRNGNNNRTDDRYGNQNANNGKYSKNAPAKVREAFNSDYPNASNVSWTKDQGYWTAHFGGGLFNTGNRTATYKANGQRVDRNNSGGIFGDRDRNNTDNRTRTNTGRRLPDIVNGN